MQTPGYTKIGSGRPDYARYWRAYNRPTPAQVSEDRLVQLEAEVATLKAELAVHEVLLEQLLELTDQREARS